MLAADRLTKVYPSGVRALDGLTMSVPAGTLYCLLGANGAGKTTTIGCFLDFLRPTSGCALVDDIGVAGEPMRARQRCAYVAESVALYEGATALDNLRFFARLGGRTLTMREASALLERTGLAALDHRRPAGRCSKGMRQKVALAIALSRGASNLLLDEPTSGLDPLAAAELMALLRSLRDEGHAILMSTHDVERAARGADRVGIMREGRLVRELSRVALDRLSLDAVYAACLTSGRAA